MSRPDTFWADWLNEKMDQAIQNAKQSGWSEEGQILFIRREMEKAYEAVRQLGKPHVKIIDPSTQGITEIEIRRSQPFIPG